MPEDIRTALTQAVNESDDIKSLMGAWNETAYRGGDDGTGDEPEAATPDDAPPEPPGEDGPDAVTEGGDSAPAEAPQGTAEDAPESYFGVDLSDIPVEKRADIIRELSERDDRIRSVMQQNAELKAGATQPAPQQQEAPAPAPEPAAPTAPTDEELLASVGLTQDNPLYEVMADTLLPIAKQRYEDHLMVERIVAEREAEQALAYWDQQLDGLETQFGRVPDELGGRDAIITWALENDVFDPAAAYHSVTAGIRQSLNDAAAQARQEALQELKRSQAGAVRPRGQDTEPRQRLEHEPGGDLKAAMERAAALAEQKTGLSFSQLTAASDE